MKIFYAKFVGRSDWTLLALALKFSEYILRKYLVENLHICSINV